MQVWTCSSNMDKVSQYEFPRAVKLMVALPAPRSLNLI
jgi:hypothetical protein